MVTILREVPRQLIAGDSAAWERLLAEFPPSTWTLTYYFSGPGGSFKVEATDSDGRHLAELSAVASAAFKPGRYRWSARVTDGTAAQTVDGGWIEIKPDPAKAGADFRSHARKMLDAIEAALEGQATKNQLDLIAYQVGATINARRDRELLLKLHDKYRAEVASEDGGQLNNRNIRLRFTRP